jgi:hypothetical protein
MYLNEIVWRDSQIMYFYRPLEKKVPDRSRAKGGKQHGCPVATEYLCCLNRKRLTSMEPSS